MAQPQAPLSQLFNKSIACGTKYLVQPTNLSLDSSKKLSDCIPGYSAELGLRNIIYKSITLVHACVWIASCLPRTWHGCHCSSPAETGRLIGSQPKHIYGPAPGILPSQLFNESTAWVPSTCLVWPTNFSPKPKKTLLTRNYKYKLKRNRVIVFKLDHCL